MDKQELFICACNSVEHQLIMSYFADEEDREVYCSVHLNRKETYLKRYGKPKILFGSSEYYGGFDEFIFKQEDADRLQQIADYLKTCKERKPEH